MFQQLATLVFQQPAIQNGQGKLNGQLPSHLSSVDRRLGFAGLCRIELLDTRVRASDVQPSGSAIWRQLPRTY
jgi:hypothetical protein